MKELVKSGFCFWAALDEHRTIMENKFTGLRVLWDDRTRSFYVLED